MACSIVKSGDEILNQSPRFIPTCSPNLHFCTMIRKILLLLLLACPGLLSAQKNTYQVFKGDTINRTDAKGLKQGLWRKYYRTDTLCSETWFKNNKPTGISRTWYENGKLKAEVVFEKNSPKGKAVSFYESGKVMARGI